MTRHTWGLFLYNKIRRPALLLVSGDRGHNCCGNSHPELNYSGHTFCSSLFWVWLPQRGFLVSTGAAASRGFWILSIVCLVVWAWTWTAQLWGNLQTGGLSYHCSFYQLFLISSSSYFVFPKENSRTRCIPKRAKHHNWLIIFLNVRWKIPLKKLRKSL